MGRWQPQLNSQLPAVQFSKMSQKHSSFVGLEGLSGDGGAADLEAGGRPFVQQGLGSGCFCCPKGPDAGIPQQSEA